MENLEEKKLLQICWQGKRKGHIIDKVQLNTEKLADAYAYVRRVPRNDMEAGHRQLLEECLANEPTPVCRSLAVYLLERLAAHRSVKEFVQLEDTASTERLLRTIQAIEQNREQLYVREFSIRHFQDSKAFENMAGRVAHVFRRFKAGCEEAELEEILAEYGIYHTPNYVYLKGNATLIVGAERIDLSALRQGIGVSGEDIGRIRFEGMTKVKQVITIENLTTYFRWQAEDGLLLYLGGYHNSIRRALIMELYAACPQAAYYHFGDIDAGGFEIYRDLREKTGIPFRMYRMDLKTLQAYESYGRPLTGNDRKRLQGMRGREELGEVIAYMLEHNVKLEQECIRV